MAETATTQIQKHFLISSVYKRGRRYFDIEKLNHLQRQQEVERRSPQPTKQTIETRVSDSFVCSNDLLIDKVSNDLSYFHSKPSPQDLDEIETTYTAQTKKPKALDMRKMLSRSDVTKERLNHRNEERFNNFSFSKHKARKSLDFESYLGRNREGPKTQRLRNPEKEQFSSQKVGKMYEHCLFDQSHYRCFVDFQKNGKTQPKKEIDNKPIYDPAKVKRGEYLTKSKKGHLTQFYYGNGKYDASQLDNRLLKDNQYFWKSAKMEQARLRDFDVIKRKEDEIKHRLNRILERKKVVDDKEEMCDQKYFKRRSDI